MYTKYNIYRFSAALLYLLNAVSSWVFRRCQRWTFEELCSHQLSGLCACNVFGLHGSKYKLRSPKIDWNELKIDENFNAMTRQWNAKRNNSKNNNINKKQRVIASHLHHTKWWVEISLWTFSFNMCHKKSSVLRICCTNFWLEAREKVAKGKQ